MIVPVLPPVDVELIEAHARAHTTFAESFRRADPLVQRLFTLLQRRIVVESLAYVQAVSGNPETQLLVPPPRAFLSISKLRRMQGADAAFRHIDSRSAMRQMGAITSVLESTTPVVLHALLEGPAPSDRETNPGMLRVTPTAWKPEANAYVHPPAADVPALVEAAVDMARSAPAPACARAAWLTFTMLSIHPFVDGNGRTSRALAMAVLADDLPLGIDWGLLEQWSVDRSGYVDTLQAGQSIPRYDPLGLDPLPFMTFSTTASTFGAHLCAKRLALVAEQCDTVAVTMGLPPELAMLVVAIRMLRSATPADLHRLGQSDIELTAGIDDLVRRGLVRWIARPPSRRTLDDPERFAVATT